MFDSLLFAVDVTLPISIIIVLGIYLKHIGWITDEFSNIGSRLVFNITLPCLLFINVATAEFSGVFPLHLVLFASAITTVFFFLIHVSAFYIPSVSSRGAFVQASCRSNVAIVGLSLCVNAFGEKVFSLVSMYLAVIVIFYNIYSILTLYYHQSKSPSVIVVFKSVLKNPLAVAIFLAMIIVVLPITLPTSIVKTGDYISGMTLPLALLCVGASIRWYEFSSSLLLYLAIAGKLLVIPLISTVAGYYFGIRGQELGVLYIMMAAPTAVVAYPMTRAVGGDYHLTAAIIAGSTLLSMLTYTLGLFLLRLVGWI